jgi:hypothetical protein
MTVYVRIVTPTDLVVGVTKEDIRVVVIVEDVVGDMVGAVIDIHEVYLSASRCTLHIITL